METKEEWLKIEAKNKLIHEWMGLQPEIEYCIMKKDESAIRYSPKNIGFDSWQSQKFECERYMIERRSGYMYMPMDEYKIGKLENYPHYEYDYNELMRVVAKIESGDYGVKICRRVVEIYVDSDKTVLVREKRETKLESLYHAIINFIYQQKQVNNS